MTRFAAADASMTMTTSRLQCYAFLIVLSRLSVRRHAEASAGQGLHISWNQAAEWRLLLRL
jgi:hypothetical protein